MIIRDVPVRLKLIDLGSTIQNIQNFPLKKTFFFFSNNINISLPKYKWQPTPPKPDHKAQFVIFVRSRSDRCKSRDQRSIGSTSNSNSFPETRACSDCPAREFETNIDIQILMFPTFFSVCNVLSN